MKSINKTRRTLYKSARILGDINAVASGNPAKMVKRFGRKFLGRKTGRTIRRIVK